MFDVFISTNVLMAIAPAIKMFCEKERRRGSVGLAFFIVCGTIATFLPEELGLYTTSDPAYFSRPCPIAYPALPQRPGGGWEASVP